jgi:hypothetical protein
MLGAGLDFRLLLKLIASCGLEVIPLVSEPIGILSRDLNRLGTFIDKARIHLRAFSFELHLKLEEALKSHYKS